MLMIKLCILNDAVFGNRVFQIILEQPLDRSGICTGTTQECSRFKSSASGTHGKVFGIQNNTRKQRLGLQSEYIRRLHNILQQLGDKLRS